MPACARRLGGAPALLGRASEVGSFVRHGAERGYIEIELEEPNQASGRLIIKREIKKSDNSSKWFLAGKQSNAKQVKQRLKVLKVQVDNLCQFLPQDRVGDFTQMDAEKLLKETMLAILGTTHVDMLEELVALQKQQSMGVDESKQQQESLERLKDEVKQSMRDVKRIQARTPTHKLPHSDNPILKNHTEIYDRK